MFFNCTLSFPKLPYLPCNLLFFYTPQPYFPPFLSLPSFFFNTPYLLSPTARTKFALKLCVLKRGWRDISQYRRAVRPSHEIYKFVQALSNTLYICTIYGEGEEERRLTEHKGTQKNGSLLASGRNKTANITRVKKKALSISRNPLLCRL